jgi:hypothetical protein
MIHTPGGATLPLSGLATIEEAVDAGTGRPLGLGSVVEDPEFGIHGRFDAPLARRRGERVEVCADGAGQRRRAAYGCCGGPIKGVLTGAARPMNTTRPSPPGLVWTGSINQLLATQTLPEGSMDTPVLRSRALLG